jgi:enterochelin esterase-like enzyme
LIHKKKSFQIKTMQAKLENNFVGYSLKHFNVSSVLIRSQALKKNPLSDPHERWVQVLTPKPGPIEKVIYVLAGFSGVGAKYFNVKFKEHNFPQVLDELSQKNLAPQKSAFVFVDAITFWGGSQFINSLGTGEYESFLVKEVIPTVEKLLGLKINGAHRCAFGGSSGGYGALHLCSKFPEVFSYAVAIAPDSFFEMSLLPEIYSAMPTIQKYGGVKAIRKEIKNGDFLSRRDAFTVLNAIGMGTCYAPDPNQKDRVLWPIDSSTGELDGKVWSRWKKHDPIHFLKKREKKLKQVKSIYLDVGSKDQYFLQYGTRQIFKVLKAMNIKTKYNEFNGNHFDISNRRPQAYKWLLKNGF